MTELVVGEIYGIYMSTHGCFYMQTADEAGIFSGVKCCREEKLD